MAEKKNAPIETAIADAVADSGTTLSDTETTQEDADKLDARAELFVRRVSDSVTKAIADIVRPPVTETTIEPVVTENQEVKQRKKKVQQKLTILDWLLS
jgi:hypothetical protein